MIDLGLAVFLGVVAAGVGRRVLARLRELPVHPADALALAVPLGLGVLALGTLALGELGCLNPAGLSVLLAAAIEFGVVGLARTSRGGSPMQTNSASAWLARLRVGRRPDPTSRDACSDPSSARRPPWASAEFPSWALGFCLALLLAGTFVAAQAPVTDGDALCYHLQVPKVFLRRGCVEFLPDLHESVYPLVTEMLYLVGLAFRGPGVSRWISWLLGLLFAANVGALARPSLGRRAWWAAAIALLVPAVSNGMSAPLNDVALASFGTAAVYAWVRMHERRTTSAAILAGLLAGLALGVKYPALVLGGLLVAGNGLRVATLWNAPADRRRWLRLALLYIATALLAGGCWYARAYVHTGNPVYPFFREFFGGAGLAEVLDPIKRPLVVTPWTLATSLGPLTLEPDRFDSFSHQFGPVFLLFLPALLVERAPRRLVALVALGYLFMMISMTQRQSMRFLLLALGPMSIGVAYLAGVWWDRKTTAARALSALLLAGLAFEAGVAVLRSRHAVPVLLGRETVSEYLARREPTYQVGRWTEENLPESARLIGQDHRGFYIPRDYTMELAHRRRTGLGRNGEQAGEIIRRLKGSGFTHLLMCPPVPETALEFDGTLQRLLAPWLAAREPVFRRDLVDGDGVMRRYSIYELGEERLSSRLPEGSRR
jgi:hypothetical protein